MKTLHISDITEIVTYNGFTEMLLQEEFKKLVTGTHSEVTYVSSQHLYYVYGELTFEPVIVDGVTLND